jgi:hypothetical protein
MDDDEEMKNQCFGGEYLGEVFDHMLKRSKLLTFIFFNIIFADSLCFHSNIICIALFAWFCFGMYFGLAFMKFVSIISIFLIQVLREFMVTT